jgi:tetratricopeptide (TPR) repeat protein
VKIWDASGGLPVKELEMGASGVGFSPDGRWLLTAGAKRLWRAGSWEEGPVTEVQDAWTGFAFTSDGSTMTHNTLGGFIHLRDVDTGREYARLQFPDGALTVRSTFSPDNAVLVAVNDNYQGVDVWDLRALGRELVAAGFEWQPPFPSPQPQEPGPPPLNVTVLPADPKVEWLRELREVDQGLVGDPADPGLRARRGRLCYQLGRFDEAVRELSRSLASRRDVRTLMSRARAYQLLKNDAAAAADWHAALEMAPTPSEEALICNNLAWLLVARSAAVRAPEEALKLAGRAVRLSPNQSSYLNTLGVAYYRLGRFDEAAETLRRSLLHSDAPAHDLVFLAMSFQKLSQSLKARDFYSQAEYWLSINEKTLTPSTREELRAFCLEAKELGLR